MWVGLYLQINFFVPIAHIFYSEVFYIKQELPINEQIRAKEVQVIDENGEKKGVMRFHDALDLAYDKKLDLVLVAPNAQPPVCKLMNYGKYKFEQAKKEKEAKKKQKVFEVKEIRITPNIEQHDFEFKAKNARKFLEDGNKVKITVRFRGRELNYVKLGEANLNKFIESLEKSCKNSVKTLKTAKVKHIESIRLINQAYKTIKNSEKNLNKYNFVDSYTLLRASLEYIVMSYMIEVEEKTYNEFLILSNNDIQLKRKFTVPNTLLKKFGKRLNKISNNLFTDTTVKQREKIMVDLYDILCKYTHASIVVSTFNEIEDKNEQKVVKLILSYNLYLIKLILLDCLRFFNNDDKEYIDEKTIGLSLFLSIIKLVNLIQANNIKFDKIKQFFYYDTINSEFYTYYKEGLEKIKKEISESIVEFKADEKEINHILDEFMKL